MKTLLYVVLILLVLALLGGGIYYLVTQVDFSGVTDKVSDTTNSVKNWFSDKFSVLTDLFD